MDNKYIGTKVNKLLDELITQSATIEESTSAIEEIANNSQKISEMVNSASDSAIKNGKTLDDFHDKLSESNNLIEVLGEYGMEVNGIVEVINEISNTTKLLSLNAMIESAHAGEFGKGFAVIANETKKLSDETKKNAKDISNVLKNVKEKIELVTLKMNDIMLNLQDIIESNTKRKENAKLISENMQELSSANEQMSACMQQQSACLQELVSDGEELKEMLKEE